MKFNCSNLRADLNIWTGLSALHNGQLEGCANSTTSHWNAEVFVLTFTWPSGFSKVKLTSYERGWEGYIYRCRKEYKYWLKYNRILMKDAAFNDFKEYAICNKRSCLEPCWGFRINTWINAVRKTAKSNFVCNINWELYRRIGVMKRDNWIEKNSNFIFCAWLANLINWLNLISWTTLLEVPHDFTQVNHQVCLP